MRNYVHRIPLGSGKWAYEQNPDLIENAECWIRDIRVRWHAPKHFFHLKSGGHVAAVRSHLNDLFFAKMDLRKYFEQVTKNRIIRRLTKLGFPSDEVINFAVASTIRTPPKGNSKFVLPYGFIQSAILASLDTDFSALGREIQNQLELGSNISVYVDDIIISGPSQQIVEKALSSIRRAVELSNLQINEEKSTEVLSKMTAFNINFEYGEMKIDKSRLNEFEAAILSTYNDDAKIAVLAYVKSVNVEQANTLFDNFKKHLICAQHIL